MHSSYHKHKKTYTALLLLWVTGLLGLGKQKLAAKEDVPQVYYNQRQSYQGLTLTTPPLTIAQQEWLDRTLKKESTYKKQFKKMLVHINDPENFVRLVAYQKLCQLLMDHPELANKQALKHTRKILRKVGIQKESREAVQLLGALINTNLKLASPIVKILVKLTKAPNKPASNTADYEGLKTLTQAVVESSPGYVPYLLKSIHQRTRVNRNSITSSSGTTIPGLYVIEQLLHTDILNKDLKYFDQVLEVVLDGASLHDLSFGKPPYKNEEMQMLAQRLLTSMVKQSPTMVKAKYEELATRVQNEVPDMIAMAHLVAFAAVDHQHTEQLFVLFTDILEATDTRIQGLANKLYSDQQRASTNSNIGKGITDSLSGTIVDAAVRFLFRTIVSTAFDERERNFAKEQAKLQEDRTVTTPLLRLLQEIASRNASYLPKVLAITQKILEKAEESTSIRVEVLNTFICIVTQNKKYIPEAIPVLSHHVCNKSTYIRKATLQLLDAIFKADNQYVTDSTVLDSLNRLKQDQHAPIQKQAQELYKKVYISS